MHSLTHGITEKNTSAIKSIKSLAGSKQIRGGTSQEFKKLLDNSMQ